MDGFLGREDQRKVERTFGIREDDGGDGGAPVGDADGELARLELVHAHHLPPRRTGRAESGGARARAQQREEQRSSSSHDQPTQAGVVSTLRLKKDDERRQKLNRRDD